MQETLKINKTLIDQFIKNQDQISASSPEFLQDLRLEAMDRFRQLGLPGKRNELYKYTPLDNVFHSDYMMLFAPSQVDLNVEEMFTCDVPNLKTRLEIILNGFYFTHDKPLTEMDNGIIIGSLAEALKTYPEIVKKHYAKYASFEQSGLTALNTAFAQDGLFLYIPKNTKLKDPIQVVHLPMTGLDTLLHYRNLFVLEEHAEGEVIVCDHTLSPFRFLTNSVTEVYAGPGSRFHYSRVQNEHLNSNLITNLYVHQERDSNVTSNTISLHGGMIRNNTHVRLNAEGCENNTSGLFFADRKQHVDNYVFIDHAMPNCVSTQLFKGILDDQATGAFNGHILVRPDAQKTNAYQTNNNILLSDESKMNTKPQLEIYADDVKCSHGATTGQLDEEALFYMQSRGIPRREARLLMLYAFAWDVIDHLNIKPLKDRISHLVNQRLSGELSRCNNCSMNCGEIQS
jgi:Fe-S cluster assembly protein SufD